jgi:drug/metabolite transporter (DMT)-like permease
MINLFGDRSALRSEYAIATGLMLLSSVVFATLSLLAKQLMDHFALAFSIFLRFFAPFLIALLVYLIFFREPISLRSAKGMLLRPLFTVAAQYCFFYYLLSGNLLNANLLYNTNAFFIPMISYAVFGRSIGIKPMLCITIGFVGIAIMLHPDHGLLSWPAMIGLLSGFFTACSYVTVHVTVRQASPMVVTMMMYALSALLALVVATATGQLASFETGWAELNPTKFAVIIVFSLLSLSFQTLRAKAYSLVDEPATLSPYLYTVLIFAALLDWEFYGVQPHTYAYFGAIFVVIGGVAMSMNAASQKRAS